MLTRTLFVLSIALWSASQSAHGEGVLAPKLDCGQWLDARQTKQSSVYEAFVNGLLTGMSMGSGISLWGYPPNPVSQAQLFYWLDEYCRTNPLKTTLQAVAAFADEVSHNAYSRAALRPPAPAE